MAIFRGFASNSGLFYAFCASNIAPFLRMNKSDSFLGRPSRNLRHMPVHHLDERHLAEEPARLDNHPKEKVRLEIHLTNQRVAKREAVDGEVAIHGNDAARMPNAEPTCRDCVSSFVAASPDKMEHAFIDLG